MNNLPTTDSRSPQDMQKPGQGNGKERQGQGERRQTTRRRYESDTTGERREARGRGTEGAGSQGAGAKVQGRRERKPEEPETCKRTKSSKEPTNKIYGLGALATAI